MDDRLIVPTVGDLDFVLLRRCERTRMFERRDRLRRGVVVDGALGDDDRFTDGVEHGRWTVDVDGDHVRLDEVRSEREQRDERDEPHRNA